jgi:preprotein translocase subunit SecD
MNRRNTNWLILIIFLLALALWVDLSKQIILPNPFNTNQNLFSRNVDTRLGLDLRGGLQTLLEADLPTNSSVSSEDLAITRQILESRANALGVSEVVMQTAGERRIVAEFPGVSNPEEVVASLQQTGLLEFVDMGTTPMESGTVLKTDFAVADTTDGASATVTPEATATTDPNQPTATAVPGEATPAAGQEAPVYHTVMTGADLKEAHVSANQTGQPAVSFTLSTEGTKIFADYTSTHTNQYLGIVLDKKVISAPIVKSPITDGQGIIEGGFDAQSANDLAIQLRYGSLPVPVKVVESRTVGATLGEESVRKSLMAGMIGLGVVILFMLLYYRLPGFIADLALISYAILSLALFKVIPVVLTLPGIAGFILSIGMAVDANILIFERLKEELRAGRNLRQAIDLGWSRAWPSIRDSNTSTLITCLILYVFGNTFGASMVKGFSITLALGVVVSLFTAIIVTRTFLHTLLDNIELADHPRWFGLGDAQ